MKNRVGIVLWNERREQIARLGVLKKCYFKDVVRKAMELGINATYQTFADGNDSGLAKIEDYLREVVDNRKGKGSGHQYDSFKGLINVTFFTSDKCLQLEGTIFLCFRKKLYDLTSKVRIKINGKTARTAIFLYGLDLIQQEQDTNVSK